MDNKTAMRQRQLARAAKAKTNKHRRAIAIKFPYGSLYQLRPMGSPVVARTIGFPTRSAMMHYIRRHKLYPAIMSGKLVGYRDGHRIRLFSERRED